MQARVEARWFGIVLLGGSLLGGCALGNVKGAYEEGIQAEKAFADAERAKIEKAAAEKGTTPPPAEPECSLTMQLVNRDGTAIRMISEPVCVLAEGEALAIPRDFKLWISNAGTDDYGVCLDEVESRTDGSTVPRVKAPASNAGSHGAKSCRWNGVFRDSYPWTFIFTGPNVATAIQALRAFRNGELVWTWVPRAGSALTKVVIEGRDLTGRLVPQDAPLDVRVIPAGVTVDQSVLSARVEKKPSQWQVQFVVAKDAILSSPSVAGGILRDKVDCLRHRVELVNYYAGQIAGATGKQPTAPKDCKVDVAPPDGESLLGRYRDLKGKTAEEVATAERELKQKISTYKGKLGTEERKKLEEFQQDVVLFWEGKEGWWPKNRQPQRDRFLKDMEDPEILRSVVLGNVPAKWTQDPPTTEELWWLRTRGTPAQLSLVLKQADALVTQGLQAVDDTLALASELRQDAVRIANSPDEQARLFLRSAQALQSTTIFDGRVDNPEPLPGERTLTMRYSDHWQWFWFAPWTAFPVSFKGDPDFTAANLIPIVDVLGLRYQFTSSRLGDIRIGVGATALAFTAREVVAGTTVDKQQLRIVPEANVGLANLKLGVARILHPPNDWKENEEWRVLVGADLYKLVSGKNVEAF